MQDTVGNADASPLKSESRERACLGESVGTTLSGVSKNSQDYRLVRLAGGAHSVHSLVHHETFHPVVGPVAEAEALYVRQVKLIDRVREHRGEFVVWDVGLGAAANPLTVLRATRDLRCQIRLVSFDHTLEPLRFGLEHAGSLGYLDGYEARLGGLLEHGRTRFEDGAQAVEWEVHVGDFPTVLAGETLAKVPRPHVVMWDAFSPAKNPEMWSAPVFAGLHRALDPQRACILPTYSRSTMLRCTLLLAGFWVGVGHATGEKEETTVAANVPELIEEPLDARWLQRASRSTSAEPMWEPVYRQAPLSEETAQKLRAHPQFR